MLFLLCNDLFPYCGLDLHFTVFTSLKPLFHLSIVLRELCEADRLPIKGTLSLLEVGSASGEVFCSDLSFSLTFLCRVSITLACRCAMRKIFV